ncbi:hypothetical protein Bbelb_049410 [Branchiostoma belcheri]|nr:hypothetical protein Bbelb_049410 [Branchiostoma belcheri]
MVELETYSLYNSTPVTQDATHQDESSSCVPCGICERTVGWSVRGIECESCGCCFHASCQNIGTQSYLDLGASDVKWYSELCNAPNYSSVAYDLQGVESENADLDVESCDSENLTFCSSDSFHPTHNSTPTRQKKQDKNRPLRILNVNFQSIRGKVPEFIDHLIQSLRPDIILGTETWLETPGINSTEISPPGYSKVYRKDRNKHGGGLLVALSDATMETSLETEIVWAKVKLRGKRDLLIGSYYRPHEGLEDSLREMAESARLACQSSNAIVVLGGDFNLSDWNWEEKVLKPGSSYPNIHRQFMDIISDLGMEQIVEKPTRGENTLDIIVTNHPSLFPRVEIVPGLSDHDIPYAELQITNPCIRQKERQVLWFTGKA